jgi:hypothetical protein
LEGPFGSLDGLSGPVANDLVESSKLVEYDGFPYVSVSCKAYG